MPNDILSLWPSPRRSARPFEGATKLFDRTRSLVLAVMACIALPACGGEEDNGVTYADDVLPIFNRLPSSRTTPSSPRRARPPSSASQAQSCDMTAALA